MPSAAEALVAAEVFCGYVGSLDPRSAVKATEAMRRRLDALDAKALASGIIGPPGIKGGARGAFRIVGSAGVSTAEQRRRVNRARVVAENPQVAERMADGRLGADQIDALAVAAKRTCGAAAHDTALIDSLSATSADQAARVARDWVHQRLGAGEVQAEHDRQRRLRVARRTTTADGLAAITLAGDTPTIDIAWRAIEGAADGLYHADGGRDLPHSQHPRTLTQRLFDAATALLQQTTTGTGTGGAARPAILITASIETAAGEGHRPAHLVGTGPIADTVFDRYRCHGDLIGIVFGTDGQPLWHGRAVRTATPAQWTALIARDGGCVLCGAPHGRCEAHHLIPYHAPAQGPTDIDNLAQLCSPCHRDLHERRHTLIRGPDNIWTTHPAEPHEVPASRSP